MKPRILITGATGKVGRSLVAELSAAGIPHRAAVHSPQKGGPLRGPNTQTVRFDFDDDESICTALEDIETLVLITPPSDRQVDWATRTIDLAKEMGVQRVVRLSVLAAAMEPGITLGRWHRIVERYLQASNLDWTIVRPGPYMQNFLGLYPGADDGLHLPVGEAPVNHIDVRDVARALAAVITGSGHSGQIHMVTGGQPLTMAQAMATLGPALGRAPAYHDASVGETRATLVQAGHPRWLVDVLLELFAALSTGAVGLQTPTFRELTGKDPTTLDAFARAQAAERAA